MIEISLIHILSFLISILIFIVGYISFIFIDDSDYIPGVFFSLITSGLILVILILNGVVVLV